jgi:diguanylate cyclase (GGDEF)-like protein/PAS domain S-box-containing protein
VSVHDLDGRFVYVSPSVATVMRYSREEVVGRNVFDLVDPEDAAELSVAMADFASGRERAVVTFRWRRADGRHVWLESAVSGIADPATGQVTELRVSSRDVSERKAQEERMQRVTAELERRLAQTAAVASLGEQALESRDLHALFDAAVVAVAETLDVPLAAVTELRDADRVTLLVRAGTGWNEGVTGSVIALEESGTEDALDRLVDGPVSDEDREPLRLELLAEHGVGATMQALVGTRQAPWGFLSAHVRGDRRFDDHDRDFLHAVAHVLGDAVERHRAEEAARHDALHDSVTRLPNRALLLDRLAHALRRRDQRVAVVLLDVDDFRVVNESLGHTAGDRVLAQVAPRLAAELRPGDTIARFSGDAFAVVCEDVDDDTHAERIAERLTAAFATPFCVDGEDLFVTASAGVVVGAGGDRPEDLIRDADAAMCRAKETGHGRWERFDPRLRDRALARLRIETELRRAIAGGELRLHFQPYWSLPDHGLAGVEALVRWQHPERGLLGPGEFVPVAESTGLIVPLGTWVLREACRQLAAWRREHPAAAGLKLRVNLSARQVTHPGLLETVAAALRDHDIEPAAVGLEITEGLLLQDSAGVAATLNGLKELGVALVLDDFGTGYSSLSYLRRFPIDQLKIDRSFVAGLEEHESDRAIVRAIVGMAAALGLTVVPEGVETDEQLGALVELGCDFAQGFLLARPLEPAAVEELL